MEVLGIDINKHIIYYLSFNRCNWFILRLLNKFYYKLSKEEQDKKVKWSDILCKYVKNKKIQYVKYITDQKYIDIVNSGCCREIGIIDRCIEFHFDEFLEFIVNNDYVMPNIGFEKIVCYAINSDNSTLLIKSIRKVKDFEILKNSTILTKCIENDSIMCLRGILKETYYLNYNHFNIELNTTFALACKKNSLLLSLFLSILQENNILKIIKNDTLEEILKNLFLSKKYKIIKCIFGFIHLPKVITTSIFVYACQNTYSLNVLLNYRYKLDETVTLFDIGLFTGEYTKDHDISCLKLLIQREAIQKSHIESLCKLHSKKIEYTWDNESKWLEIKGILKEYGFKQINN